MMLSKPSIRQVTYDARYDTVRDRTCRIDGFDFSYKRVYVGVFVNRIIGIHFLSEARRIVVLISN